MITAAQVKELREKTGAGMMDCKKVLTETNGDEEKAIELLRERGIMKAAKKSDRIAAEGLVETYISEDAKLGAIVEVNAETDFVAKNADFQAFVKDVVKQVALNNPASVEELLAQKFINDESLTVQEELTNKIATIGENMSIRRFERFETEGTVASYIHGDGKIGVLLDIENADEQLAKDICMHIAAAKPEFLSEADVPQDRVEKEKEILKAQVINEGRPEAVAEKIVAGRLGKFYGEICLLDQEFVKDPNQKVKDLVASKKQKSIDLLDLKKAKELKRKKKTLQKKLRNN